MEKLARRIVERHGSHYVKIEYPNGMNLKSYTGKRYSSYYLTSSKGFVIMALDIPLPGNLRDSAKAFFKKAHRYSL
jgi:hypothetical protein